MSKRKYTHIGEVQEKVLELLSRGKTQREVAEHFGFTDKYVVKEFIKRHRRKAERMEVGIIPHPKGRPRKDAAWAFTRYMMEASAELGMVDVDDYFHALLRLQDGATGTFSTSRFAFGRGNYQSLEVHGDKGALCYNLEQQDSISVCYGQPLAQGSQFVELAVPEEFQMDQMQQFFNICKGKGDGLGATLRDGLAVQQIIESMVTASSQAAFTKVK